MKKKIIIITVLVIVAAAAILAVIAVHRDKSEHAEKAGIQISEEKPETEEPEETASEKPEEKEQNAEEDAGQESMEINGLTEEMLSIMGVQKENVSRALRKWTLENGYSSAVGAEFYEPVWIRSTEQKISIDCRLIMFDDGNGIQKDGEQLVLTMDCFNEKGLIQFHY